MSLPVSLPMSRRLEIGLLLALCIFLPLYEAPKNLAWLAYALVWSANRVRERDVIERKQVSRWRLHELHKTNKASIDCNYCHEPRQ